MDRTLVRFIGAWGTLVLGAGVSVQSVYAEPQRDSVQLLDQLTQAGTWAFDLPSSWAYLKVAGQCAADGGNDTGKRDACLAKWTALASRDGMRLEKRGEQVYWSSVSRGADGAERNNLSCPMRTRAVGPNLVSVSPSGPCTGTDVPRDLREKQFSADDQEREAWGLALLDANTLLRLDTHGGFETFRLKPQPAPGVVKVALLDVTIGPGHATTAAELTSALREQLTSTLRNRVQWVEPAQIAETVARNGGGAGSCGPTCIAGAAAKSGVDYVFVGSVEGQVAGSTLAVSAISSRLGTTVGRSLEPFNPDKLDRAVGIACDTVARIVETHTMTGWSQQEYAATMAATVTGPRAEADVRQTVVALPRVGKFGAGTASPLPFQEDSPQVVVTGVAGKRWLFTVVDRRLYRADARTPQTWTEVSQTGDVHPFRLSVVQGDRLWGWMCFRSDMCSLPLAAAIGAKVEWQPAPSVPENGNTTDGTALYIRPPGRNGEDAVGTQRSLDGKKWAKVVLPPKRAPDSSTRLLVGPGYRLFADVESVGATALVYSSTDGQRWQQQVDTATFGLKNCDHAVGSASVTILVCENGILGRAKAGDWQPLIRAPRMDRRFDKVGPDAVFARIGDGGLASFDGGATWYSYTAEDARDWVFHMWVGINAQTALEFRKGEVVVHALTRPSLGEEGHAADAVTVPKGERPPSQSGAH